MAVIVKDTGLEKKKKLFFNAVGLFVKTKAEGKVPVVDGKLKSSIYYEVEGNRVKIGTKGVSYAGFVEWGTSPMVRAHGAHNPKAPVTSWKALRKRNAEGLGYTLPFLRNSAFESQDDVKKIGKEIFG